MNLESRIIKLEQERTKDKGIIINARVIFIAPGGKVVSEMTIRNCPDQYTEIPKGIENMAIKKSTAG